MELTKQQKDSLFTELLINTFMSNPLLYDKSEENYVYTQEKIKLLKKLSDYLRDEFKILKGVPDIVAAWQKLVAQFKKADEKQATGSAATSNDFPYYQDLLFLKNTLKHKSALSSLNIPATSQSINKNLGNSSQTMPFITADEPASENNYSKNASEDYLQSNFRYKSGFGPDLHLPVTSPYCGPSSGQYPYWPMISPYAFGPYPYLPLSPHAVPPPVVNYPYMPTISATQSQTTMSMNTPPVSLMQPQIPMMSSTPAPSAIPMMSSTPAPAVAIQKKATLTTHTVTSFNSSSVPCPSSVASRKRVPEFDHFAKKKLKVINDSDEQMKPISDKIFVTLSNVNEKMNASQANSASCQATERSELDSTDYSNLLSNALSKVPAELQDELMEYILEGLLTFSPQDMQSDK